MSELRDETPRLTLGSILLYAGLGLAAVLATGVVCSFIGQYHIEKFWFSDPVVKIRLNHLLTAAVVGAALSAAGMALQGMLRNPLAEPYILGISSGAGVGVLVGPAVAAWLGLAAWYATPVLSLIGALATCVVVYGIAQRRGRLDPYVLLLSGVIVNVFNGALMLGIMLVSSRNAVLNYISWGMGGIPDAPSSTALLIVCICCVIIGWLVLLLRGAAFNTLGLGDDVAVSSGVAVHRLRVETFVVVGLMTAAAVALAGPIGFVGLIVPHICRIIAGADHRRLVLVSGFAGAVMLMIADTFARTAGAWIGTGDIPVGVITALAGGPFFIFLLRRRSREGAQ